MLAFPPQTQGVFPTKTSRFFSLQITTNHALVETHLVWFCLLLQDKDIQSHCLPHVTSRHPAFSRPTSFPGLFPLKVLNFKGKSPGNEVVSSRRALRKRSGTVTREGSVRSLLNPPPPPTSSKILKISISLPIFMTRIFAPSLPGGMKFVNA